MFEIENFNNKSNNNDNDNNINNKNNYKYKETWVICKQIRHRRRFLCVFSLHLK